MKTKVKFPLLLAISLCIAAPANAALTMLYSTNFNSPLYSDGGLVGQDGWAITGTSVVNPIMVANTATNGNVSITTSGQDVNRIFTPTPIAAGSFYMSASMTVASASVTGDYFLHFGDAGTSNFYDRLFAKTSGAGFALAMGTAGNTGVVYGSELPFNTPMTVMIRYDFVDGAANDTGAVFINPTTEDGSGDTAYVQAVVVGTDSTGISSVRLRQGNTTPNVTIDNISVLASVPEPASALLGALGLLGLLRRRR